jgi:hypothetical protein
MLGASTEWKDPLPLSNLDSQSMLLREVSNTPCFLIGIGISASGSHKLGIQASRENNSMHISVWFQASHTSILEIRSSHKICLPKIRAQDDSALFRASICRQLPQLVCWLHNLAAQGREWCVYWRLPSQVFVCDRYRKSDRETASLEIDLCDDRVAV